MYKILIFSLLIFISACGNSNKIKQVENTPALNSLMDTILPFFAKLHDSIPETERFDSKHSEYIQKHKVDKDYQWLYYKQGKDSFYYFMIYRQEPSIKKDKYSTVCGRFKRDSNGKIDMKSFEELFWTWKMKKEVLLEKSEHLFGVILDKGNINAYTPENNEEEWVEFPGNGVVYDKATQSWVQKGL